MYVLILINNSLGYILGDFVSQTHLVTMRDCTQEKNGAVVTFRGRKIGPTESVRRVSCKYFLKFQNILERGLVEKWIERWFVI
jgi:hypothetical protein